VLAYLFWHRPRAGVGVEAYEQAQVAFHRSLAHRPPVGLCGTATFRTAELPWLGARAEADLAADAPAYEDWYLLEDYAALGVLNEAAVGRGHRTAHDDAARHFGAGSGGLYAHVEGERPDPGRRGRAIAESSTAVWVARPAGAQQQMLGELLGDGMDPRHASLWRRQLVMGPAPEFCLLAPAIPDGVSPARLPAGWSAQALERTALFSG
jgi:hypothetical protein